MEQKEERLHEQHCLIAVTREATKGGDVAWVVWYNGEVLCEEESAVAALAIARAIISGA